MDNKTAYTKTPKEHAKAINWIPSWDVGAPMPQIFSNGYKTFLIYIINEADLNFESTDNTATTSPKYDTQLALIEFVNSHTHRFGIVNDEAYDGHPLYNNGLELYSAHVIENSVWIEQLKDIHKVHAYYDEERWSNLKHFLLFFHDEMFEIIAEDYLITTHETTMLELSIEVIKLLSFQ